MVEQRKDGLNPEGMTPTIVYGFRSMVMMPPMMSAPRPNAFAKNRDRMLAGISDDYPVPGFGLSDSGRFFAMLKQHIVLWTASAVLISFVMVGSGQAPAPYDLLIRNVRIVDGTGASWFRGDLAVRGDTIVAVGRVPLAEARATIGGNGQVLAPGFIDIRTHAAEFWRCRRRTIVRARGSRR